MQTATKIVILLSLLTLSPLLTANGAMTVVYGADYKPFAWGDEQQAFGIQKDFIEAVLEKEMGLAVKHEACPWARCQILVKQGLKDAFFTVSTLERSEYTKSSTLPFYQTHFLMHTREGNPNIPKLEQVSSLEDLESLSSIRHIYMLGSGWHDNKLKNMQLINRLKDATKIPLMLELGRADLYIEQEEMFRYQAKELGVSRSMRTLTFPVMQVMNWHLFIGKKSPYLSLLPEINQTLKRLHESGELENIKRRIFKQYEID